MNSAEGHATKGGLNATSTHLNPVASTIPNDGRTSEVDAKLASFNGRPRRV